MTPDEAVPTDWPEALATVLSCTYDARAGRALAFCLSSSKHFRIAYNYWAEGTLHTGELYAEKAIPQGSLFPIRYDPELPHKHRHGHSKPAARVPLVPLVAIGIAGSVLLSLVWLLVLRGCH